MSPLFASAKALVVLQLALSSPVACCVTGHAVLWVHSLDSEPSKGTCGPCHTGCFYKFGTGSRQDQRRLRYRVFPLLRVAAHHGRNPLLWLVVPVPGAFSIICPAELLVPALYSEEATASEPAVVSRWCRSCRATFRMRNRYIEAVAEKDCERVAWFDREFDEFLRRMSEWRAPPPGLGTATHLTSLD